MLKPFLEAGQIVGTHGIRGEVKIQPWTNTPDFLCTFKSLFFDGAPVKVTSARVHKSILIVQFDGIDTLDGAIALKGKTVYIARKDARLPEGEHFISDLIGLDAIDEATNQSMGVVHDVLDLPGHKVYVIGGTREILIPAVPEFVRSIDLNTGRIVFHLIEGM